MTSCMGIWVESLAFAGIIQTHAIFFERMWALSGFTFIMHFVAYASFTLFPQRTIIPLHTRNDSESG